MAWSWLAYRYLRRNNRRRNFHTSPFLELVNLGLVALLDKRKTGDRIGVVKSAGTPISLNVDYVPARFTPQETWKWDESDLEYFRYATDLWKVFTVDQWGVLRLPAGSDASTIFLEIARQQEDDHRGTLAHGVGPNNPLHQNLPVLLVFRLRDGYQQFFAAVQSWNVVDRVIAQDAPLLQKTIGPKPAPRIPRCRNSKLRQLNCHLIIWCHTQADKLNVHHEL